VADAGEVMSLAAAGITSISLVSDGIASLEAGGDVFVAGNSTFTYVNDNGETVEGTAGDAAFSYEEAESRLEGRIAGAGNSFGMVSAAVAAMGLASYAETRADSHSASGLDTAAAASGTGIDAGQSVASDNAADAGRSLLGSESMVAANDDGDQGPIHSAQAVAEQGQLSGGDAGDDQGPSELLQGTDMPSADHHDAVIDIAPAAVMADAGSVEGTQHNGLVEMVLAETVENGGQSGIDALLASLPNAPTAADSLASQPGSGVPAWDNGHFGGFTPGAQQIITTEAMVLHHDAVQPVLG